MRVYGNLMNRVMEDSRQPIPEIGMGATQTWSSDRHACTIVTVLSSRRIQVRRDIATRILGIGQTAMSESQNYSYTFDFTAPLETFTLRKNGRWVAEGQSSQNGTGLIIGDRDEYYDYSF